MGAYVKNLVKKSERENERHHIFNGFLIIFTTHNQPIITP
jgi:hypothetical protein